MLRLVWSSCVVLTLASTVHADLAPAPRAAPNCVLDGVLGDQRYEVRQFHGKVLWLDFWASWCRPCAEAFPFLDDLSRDLGARGFAVLAVNLDEKRDDARAFLAEHPVEFALAADPTGDCPRYFGVEAMPAAYLIDRQGFIRQVHLGFRAGEAAKLRAAVEALLAEAAHDAE